jgi:DNA-binding transcriptional LysR family regulator
MVTFKQLEALYWIANLGSFSEAAAKLHATQSAISKRVQELELQFKTELFDRSHRSARLTEKGEELLLFAKKMLEQRDMAIEQFSRTEVVERSIRIGVTELTAMTWLPRLVERLQQSYPDLVIEPDVDMGLSLREKLMRDQTDIILVPGGLNDSTLIVKPLAKVENVWMCKPGFLGRKKTMHLQELVTHRLLIQGEMSGTGSEYSRWLRSLNVQPENILACNNLIALLALTVSGLGVSYLPRECLRQMTIAGMLEVVNVKPSLPAVKYVALCKKEHRSALFASIMALAQECCDFTLMFQSGQ